MNSREEEIRTNLIFEDCIRQIKQTYHAEYDPNTLDFDAFDQLLACEALAESSPIIANINVQTQENENVNVSGSVNGTRKHSVYFELTQRKKDIISKLSACDYKTSPIEVAQYLELFFGEWISKDGHWLYIAQKWNPRAILRTIKALVRRQVNGQETIKNPSAYFTHLINYRKKRRDTKKIM